MAAPILSDPLAPTRLDLRAVVAPLAVKDPLALPAVVLRDAERRAALRLLAALLCERPILVPRVLGEVFGGDAERMREEIDDGAAREVLARYLSAEPVRR